MILNTALLFAIGLAGWFIFKLLRIPTPALLGTLVLFGVFKALQIDVPSAPQYLAPFVQIFMGLYIGTMVTKEKVYQLKEMTIPAIIIVVWVLVVAFLFGSVLANLTYLDVNTAILSSSMGGLPEMTVLAMGTNAQVEVVIVMLVFRMLATILIFPFILKYIMKSDGKKVAVTINDDTHEKYIIVAKTNNKTSMSAAGISILTFVIAGLGGTAFTKLGIPAGAMVGSMVFIISASMLGVKLIAPPSKILPLMLIGVGIMVSDNISLQAIQGLIANNILLIASLFTIAMFISSLLIALLISKVSKWDFATCFLAVAPAGLSVMVALAIDYGKDPLRISALHLCRLITLKTILPLVFMWLVN